MRLFLDFSTWQGLSWRNEEQQQHFQIILFMPTLLCTCGFVWHLKCESCCDLISPHFCECFVEHPILREPERCWLDKPHFAPFLWKFSLSIQSFRFQQYMMPGISLISDVAREGGAWILDMIWKYLAVQFVEKCAKKQLHVLQEWGNYILSL